jgi:deazaflavin-dependent oxidoreductase (nitroreductase family)
MLLKHKGRKTGVLRETVIEIIDQDKERGKIYAASGFGESSQWFKNICADNSVLLTIKNKEFPARARVLGSQGSEQVLKRYAMAHPGSIKGVAKLSGYKMDGSESDVTEFSRIIKIIEFSKAEP